MFGNTFLKTVGKAFQLYAGLALTVFLFQLLGLTMYLVDVWPDVRGNLSTGLASFVSVAVALILIRSCLWIWIYRSGARSFSILHREGNSPKLADLLTPDLRTLTRLLVVSCILDACFVPVVFMSDRLLPSPVSGFWLGAIDASILLFPQVFGIGALLLAFLTHQYGQLLKERSQMKEELEFTI
jgi:hypothetical protein